MLCFCILFSVVKHSVNAVDTPEPKLLYLPIKGLEVISSAIVVLKAFKNSPNRLKKGLSGLKGKFSWHVERYN